MKTRSSIRPLCSGADCLTFRSGRRKIRCGGLIRSSTDLRWCLPPNAMSYSEAALGSEVSRLNLVVFRGSSKIRPELSAVFSTHDLHRSTQPVAPIVLCFSMASQQHATSQFALTTLLVPRVQHQRTSRGLFFFWIGDSRWSISGGPHETFELLAPYLDRQALPSAWSVACHTHVQTHVRMHVHTYLDTHV